MFTSVSRRACAALGSGLVAAALFGCGASSRDQRTFNYDDTVEVYRDTISVASFLLLTDAERASRRQHAERWHESATQLEVQEDNTKNAQFDPAMLNLQAARHLRVTVVDVVADLRRALFWDPSDVDAATRLGRLEALIGEQVAAREHLARAWDALDALGEPVRSPRRRNVAVELAWSYRDEGLWEPARTWLERALAAAPGDPETLVLDGLVLAGEGRIAEALDAAQHIPAVPYEELAFEKLHQPPLKRIRESGAPARWVSAMAYFHDGRPDLAWHVLQPLRWQQPLLPWPHRYWQDVGLIAEMAHRPEDSLAYATAFICSPYASGLNIRTFSNPALILGEPRLTSTYFLGDTGAFARGSLFAYASNICLEYLADPQSMRAPELLDRAHGALAACLRRGISPAYARGLRGRLEYAAGNWDASEIDLAAASTGFAAMSETDAVTELLLGLTRLYAGDHAAARARLEAAVAADSLLGSSWSALGVVQATMGDRELARASLDRAVQLQPGKGSVWFNRGLLRARTGDLEGGRADLEQAARLMPNDPHTVTVLQQIQSAKRQGLTALSAPAAGEDPGVTFAGPSGTIAADIVVDRRALMEHYLAELDLAFSPEAEGADSAISSVDSLETQYACAPDADLRKKLALVYLFLGRYEDTDALLGALPVDQLDQDERTMLLFAESKLEQGDLALLLMQELVEGKGPVVDPYVWALVASIGRRFTVLGPVGANAAYLVADRDYHGGLVAAWMDIGFQEWRRAQTDLARDGVAPPSMARLDQAMLATDRRSPGWLNGRESGNPSGKLGGK